MDAEDIEVANFCPGGSGLQRRVLARPRQATTKAAALLLKCKLIRRGVKARKAATEFSSPKVSGTSHKQEHKRGKKAGISNEQLGESIGAGAARAYTHTRDNRQLEQPIRKCRRITYGCLVRRATPTSRKSDVCGNDS